MIIIIIPYQYLIRESSDLKHWSTWPEVTANDATVTLTGLPLTNQSQFFCAACMQ
ncbi:hypothetical protein SBV1_2890002 [Verrucomicrobia bacterium]|nr:hypothetical protein SBV1_2890002 [Verrucomicrobiota bacterium]